MPTAQIENPSAKSIQALLKDRQLYDGVFFPRQLDLYVCGLNDKICTVRPGASGIPGGDDAIAVWRNQVNDPINVPDIRFESVLVHKPYFKKSGDSLARIVVEDRKGCDKYDEACNLYVQNLNRRISGVLDDRFSGEIIVPTKAYRATIPIQGISAPLDRPLAKPVPLATSKARPVTRMEASVPTEVRSEARAEASKPAPAEGVKREAILREAPALADRIVPPASPRLQSNGTAAVPQDGIRADVLRLIRHPFAANKPIPEGLVHITVIDTRVDALHCQFVSSSVAELDAQPAAAAATSARPPMCGERGVPNKARDHGTHVVGLIVSKPDPALGPGVNPKAKVTTLLVNPDKFIDDEYLTKQADRLNSLYAGGHAPDVVNLSYEYPFRVAQGKNDTFHQAMLSQVRNTVFVASAGNSAQALMKGDACSVRPACYDDPNVIIVAALDLNGDEPDLVRYPGGGSNYGDRVHIGAPGLNVVSTITDNRIGPMTGTSQAAPIITGAASLLYLREKRLKPSQVKNRLIYTSDLLISTQI